MVDGEAICNLKGIGSLGLEHARTVPSGHADILPGEFLSVAVPERPGIFQI